MARFKYIFEQGLMTRAHVQSSYNSTPLMQFKLEPLVKQLYSFNIPKTVAENEVTKLWKSDELLGVAESTSSCS